MKQTRLRLKFAFFELYFSKLQFSFVNFLHYANICLFLNLNQVSIIYALNPPSSMRPVVLLKAVKQVIQMSATGDRLTNDASAAVCCLFVFAEEK